MTRLPAGGRIDRGRELRFTFNGTTLSGFAGDTLASALLANGVHQVGTSIKYGRPRGIMAAGPEEANALVQIEAPYPEPMLTATAVELYEGLTATGLPGQGRLAAEPDPARYDSVHLHCDVLVIGAGPAGLMAALTAAQSGARVVLADDQPETGGSLLGTAEPVNGAPAMDWVTSVTANLEKSPDVRILRRTSAFGCYDDGLVLALERRTDHLGLAAPAHRARQRIWRIRAREVIVAVGAHERPVIFSDNDVPGVMLASAARTYLHRYGVLAGRTVVAFTTNDSAYSAAVDIARAGAVVSVVDARNQIPRYWASVCAHASVAVRTGSVVTGTSGGDHVAAAHVAPWSGGTPGPREELGCDLLLVSGGWNPAVQLFTHARGELRYDPANGMFVPGSGPAGLRAAGAARGTFTTHRCMQEGVDAATAALGALGIAAVRPVIPPTAIPADKVRPLVLWRVPGTAGETDSGRQFVDLARDATVADILRAAGAGLTSAEHVKRYTTIGTAHDQGKTSGVSASGILADELGTDIATLGTTTFRPPYTPVAFAALAGRDRGEIFDPVRVTALHSWHARHGAVFENVGQWKRPWYYPHHGENLAAAVLRECRAARTGVAMMDGSTLGKINVQGPDAGQFLDRLYTNLMSNLKPGSVRYGVMCGLDGMIMDDGTVACVSATEYLLTTTTGNAAKVLDWMEELAQTEWPQLRVAMTSVTDHWVTVALVGPRSRDVLAAVTPELDVSNMSFPFMTWRDAIVAGLDTRVCRISFSGELAYEVNVPAWNGLALWEALFKAGEPWQITPYGTETMHVLRAEKGYPIIGQDTDGTVTPQDLGMSWVVSKKKPDFIGKRSHTRAENLRPDRKQLIGLLPVDPGKLLAEGAQLVETGIPQEPPVVMLGHVTSSYRSAALERTFALALVRSGRDRIGQTLYAWHMGELTAVTVTDPVLYDKEGTRRDG